MFRVIVPDVLPKGQGEEKTRVAFMLNKGCLRDLFRGQAFFAYIWSFLLTVELLCLQSIQVLIRGTFPL